MKTIEIKDFITVKLVEYKGYPEEYIYYVDSYNEEYFDMNVDKKLITKPQRVYTFYNLYYQKASKVSKGDIEVLKKEINNIHKELTFKIDRAEKGQYYYVIENDFTVDVVEENNDDVDNNYYKNFNYFTNKEEATKCAEKLKKYLIELRKEECCNE